MPRSKIYVSDLYHQRQLWYSSIRAVDDSIDGRMPRPSRRRLHLPRLAGSQIHDASQRLHHEPSRADEEIVANQIHPPIRLPPPRRRRRDDDADRLLGLPDAAAAAARGALHPLRHLRGRHPRRRRRAATGPRRPRPRSRGAGGGGAPAPGAGVGAASPARARAEARRDLRDLLQVLAPRAQGLHQRRQVHAPPPHDALPLPRRLHHHAHR